LIKNNKIKNIIIQAGGRGSRLETLTINKPKCIVDVDNLPIIFHLFKQFPASRFTIIADYKSDVLIKYLKAFAEGIDYKVIVANTKGTCAGIKSALENIPDKSPFMLIWCDLILPKDFNLPAENKNYIGISKSFECRWSLNKNGEFAEISSSDDGVAGLFVFKEKKLIEGIPDEGEFVKWLKDKEISFERLELTDAKEIGTLLSYYHDISDIPKCRPFNKMIFREKHVEKIPITEQGRIIAEDEINWYKFISKYSCNFVPQIKSFSPFIMERIDGKNIFEYQNFTLSQKKQILSDIVETLKTLHELDKPIKADLSDCRNNYIDKTFERLNKVRKLIPFADRDYIKINGIKAQNVFFVQDTLKDKIQKHFPEKFRIIHGDPTFSNLMLRTIDVKPYLIDPRGYFGKTKIYGDEDYDWAKLYYSIKGNYDQFNRKNFALEIKEGEVDLKISSNEWECLSDYFFELTGADREKILLLHSIIWLSLTTYAWQDYDSICCAFYNGLLQLKEAIK